MTERILTKTEKLVIKLVLNGLNNNEIANKLSISNHTVKAHLRSIYVKENVKNRIQLIIKLLSQNN